MTHVSLFTGIGGLDLAAEWAGFETILQVEIDDYANKVLEKHWPTVPRVRDVRNVNRGSVNRPVTVISGGFPCQPFSTAARGRNNAEDLWPEMLRVIKLVSPAWVIAENVQRTPILQSAEDLEHIGYRSSIFMLPACGVGSPQARLRWFVVSNTNGNSESFSTFNAKMVSLQCFSEVDKWPEPPGGLGVANGIPHRVDRLKCLGNAVVPQQAYPIFKAISLVEGSEYALVRQGKEADTYTV